MKFLIDTIRTSFAYKTKPLDRERSLILSKSKSGIYEFIDSDWQLIVAGSEADEALLNDFSSAYWVKNGKWEQLVSTAPISPSTTFFPFPFSDSKWFSELS